jgi:hypothetical protein
MKPMIFDVLGPDWETSLLPEGMRLVLHVNPNTMSVSMTRKVERIQTRGGFVEQHWGDDTTEISLTNATGGFVRLYTGLVSTTNPAYGGTRRETIAYDKYLDMLTLFKCNGAVYDVNGNIVLQGQVKLTFDEGVYLGVFSGSFSVKESSEKPYQLELSTTFTVMKTLMQWYTPNAYTEGATASTGPQAVYSEGVLV